MSAPTTSASKASPTSPAVANNHASPSTVAATGRLVIIDLTSHDEPEESQSQFAVVTRTLARAPLLGQDDRRIVIDLSTADDDTVTTPSPPTAPNAVASSSPTHSASHSGASPSSYEHALASGRWKTYGKANYGSIPEPVDRLLYELHTEGRIPLDARAPEEVVLRLQVAMALTPKGRHMQELDVKHAISRAITYSVRSGRRVTGDRGPSVRNRLDRKRRDRRS